MKSQKASLLGIFVLLAAFLLLLSSCDNKIEDPAIYNVYFISDNSVYHSQSVAEGSYISQPATPVRQGYEFTGWYIDSGCVTSFDFSNPVSGELYLYAGWKLENPDDKPAYTVSFILNGGSGVSNVPRQKKAIFLQAGTQIHHYLLYTILIMQSILIFLCMLAGLLLARQENISCLSSQMEERRFFHRT